jgi:hypothetical protein
MTKVDFKKSMDCYKAKHKKIDLIVVPPMQYIMIDGEGDPNLTSDFNDAIKTLYPISYKIKFDSKLNMLLDYVVMPLEGLWWSDDMDSFTSSRDKSKWKWTLMIMQPDWINQEMFENAVKKVMEKGIKGNFDKVRLESINESTCVQTLHIGTFDDEDIILREIHEIFIPTSHLKMCKKHHEIYLSDFRKVAPDKLKTILRQPVLRKDQ